MNKSSFGLILKLFSYLTLRRRLQLSFFGLLMSLSFLVEASTIAVIMPFLELLSNPSASSRSTESFLALIGKSDHPNPLLYSGALLLFVLTLSVIVRTLNLWTSVWLSSVIATDLAVKSYSNILGQSYQYHIKNNTSKVLNMLTLQVDSTSSAISSSLQLSLNSVVSLALIASLFFVDWQVAALACAFFFLIYSVLIYSSRYRLRANSASIARNSELSLKTLQEGLGSIRDLLLTSSQHVYIQSYQNCYSLMRSSIAKNQFISISPRYYVEGLAIFLIVILGFYLQSNSSSTYNPLPILGTLALGSQKLLPSLQGIFKNLTSIRGSKANILGVLEALSLPAWSGYELTSHIEDFSRIRLDKLSFKYDQSSEFILNNVSLEISSGDCIGVIGATGSGKSTLIDVLMGLLSPTSGTLSIDSLNLTRNSAQYLKSWQSHIAHVPQEIFLSDSTIYENIAFGIAYEDIDYERVHEAARIACIYSFIDSLQDGFNTYVGERGVLLSGGQKQRIGLARAFYMKASILVLDEATSALDIETEASVMSSIHNLSSHLTIIMITHRKSTLKQCSRILEVKNGQVYDVLG